MLDMWARSSAPRQARHALQGSDCSQIAIPARSDEHVLPVVGDAFPCREGDACINPRGVVSGLRSRGRQRVRRRHRAIPLFVDVHERVAVLGQRG